MTQTTKKILFASDLSINMKQVFEHAVTLSAFHSADIIILHVIEETADAARGVKVAFGKQLYKDLKSKHKKSAQNILIGKDVDSLKIRQAIAGFFKSQDLKSNDVSGDEPINKILVTEGRSIADEISATSMEQECNFIVMGYKKKGRIAKVMGDNVVTKVIKKSNVPVLVVPISN